MRALGFLLLVTLFSSWLFLPLSASAANVQWVPRTSATNPGLTIKNAYGSVNITNTQILDTGYNVYINGTIFGQVSNSLTSQLGQTYTYLVTSYGNGTLTVRLQGPVPQQVQTSGHLTTVIRGSQDIAYSVGDGGYGKTSVLIVNYLGISHLFRDAALTMALFTPIVIAVGLARWAENAQDPERIEKMRKLYYAALIMSLGTALLFILSMLFG